MPIQNAVMRLKRRGAAIAQKSSTTATQSGRNGAKVSGSGTTASASMTSSVSAEPRKLVSERSTSVLRSREIDVGRRGLDRFDGLARLQRLGGVEKLFGPLVDGRIPDEQHLAVAVERGHRCRENLGKRAIRAFDLRDACDGMPLGKELPEPGGHEQVADLDLVDDVVREIPQAQAPVVA